MVRLTQLTWRPVPPVEARVAEVTAAVTRLDAPLATPSHRQPLAPRDDAIFLLHIAAEIEHALMCQYLYAMMTLDAAAGGAPAPDVTSWRQIILGVAKEEMGHFLTVQNLLRLIGGPLNFERQDTPFRSKFYPFDLSLEPLTISTPSEVREAAALPPQERWTGIGSLNRYIAAEMPALDLIRPEDREEVASLVTEAGSFNRVGPLYSRLIDLFSAPTADRPDRLKDEDFQMGVSGYQGGANEWGLTSAAAGAERFDILVPEVRSREQAVKALREIAEQGEAPLSDDPAKPLSHFRKFFQIYREYAAWAQQEPQWRPHFPVPANPTTSHDAADNGSNAITNPSARDWADLFNLTYRHLLVMLQHYLSLDGTITENEPKRVFLARAAIGEMISLSGFAGRLTAQPMDAAGSGLVAAPPFDLPYTLAMPDRAPDRIRAHLDILTALVGVADRLSGRNITPEERNELDQFRMMWANLRTTFEDWLLTANAPDGGSDGDTTQAEQPETSFEHDIRPLFTSIDVDHMKVSGSRFDLSDYTDVKRKARSILRRLQLDADSPRLMPPIEDGGPWSAEQIALFEKWLSEDCPP